MDNKRLIITVSILMLLVLTWDRIFIFVGSKMGWDMSPKTVATSTTSSTTNTSAATQPADANPSFASQLPTTQTTQTATGSASTSLASAGLSTTQPNNVANTSLGSFVSKSHDFPLGLSITSLGAGLNSVTLNDYKQSVDSPALYIFQQPHTGYEQQSRPLATSSVTIDGQTRNISDVPWKLESADDRSASYSLDLFDAGKPIVKLLKSFHLFNRGDTQNGSGYEVTVTQTVQNETNRPLAVTTRLIGPTPPPREMEKGGDRQVITGYLQNDEIELVHHTVEEFVKDKATKDLSLGSNNSPLAWAGTCSGYFDAIVRPMTVGGMSHISATALVPDPDALEHLVTLSFDSVVSLAPGAASEFPMRAFFGPKMRQLLKSDYYSKVPLHYDSTLVMTSGPCSFCTSDVLISVLVKSLVAFHFVLQDWGLAIIALVICVRGILHPIMKRSQANMMKMGKMGPEIEKLKKKYGDDKDAVSKAQMQLMKEQGFTPILGCLPLFLQMPIFIALWSCLQSTFELRQEPFLYFFGHHLTWIKDLAQPDKLIYFPGHPIQFFFIHFDAINLLPLLVAVVSFINQKVTPKPPAATPEAAQQQKMMQWMTLIFPLMFYNLPSGLNLYYVTSTSIGILEGKIIRRHIKDKEDAEKGDRIIVDAKPTRASKQSKRIEGPTSGKPATGLRGLLASLQEKADQIQREAKQRPKEKP